MRFPWLQVSSGVLEKSGPLAALLGVDEERALGTLFRLWAMATDWGDPDAPPTGLIDGEDAAVIVAGACRWTGDAAKLVKALERVGFVEVLPTALRVRGIKERYARTWEKNKRRKPASEVPVTGKNRRGTGASDEDEDEDEDEDLKEEEAEAPAAAAEAAPPSVPPTPIRPEPAPAVPFVIEPPETPQDEWQGPEFWRWYQTKRQKAGFVAERPPNHRALDAWWSELRMAGATVQDLKEAAYSFGAEKFWQSKKPPLPFAGFMSECRKHLPQLRRAQ